MLPTSMGLPENRRSPQITAVLYLQRMMICGETSDLRFY